MFPTFALHILPCLSKFLRKSSIALHSSIRSRFPPTKSFQFLSEWILLVIPVLLSMTLFADRPGVLATALLLPTALFYFLFPPHESGTPLPSGGAPSPHPSPTLLRAPSSHGDDLVGRQSAAAPAEEPETTRLSALSTYRAHMMLVTILAILAVDFPVFPRALAKCETYGVSLVRLFVFFATCQLRCANRWTWVSVPLCFPRVSYPPSRSSKPRCT
jgi:phosphatidylinositol glycan class W